MSKWNEIFSKVTAEGMFVVEITGPGEAGLQVRATCYPAAAGLKMFRQEMSVGVPDGKTPALEKAELESVLRRVRPYAEFQRDFAALALIDRLLGECGILGG
jgi:hypothetical protein